MKKYYKIIIISGMVFIYGYLSWVRGIEKVVIPQSVNLKQEYYQIILERPYKSDYKVVFYRERKLKK